MIFISTGGWRNQTAVESSKALLDQGLHEIELSGGRYAPDNLQGLKHLSDQCNFQVHNYFPPPETPFVLNLATNQSDIAKQCMAHVNTAMEWAVEFKRPVYSFHGGFLIDPQVNELGKKIEKRVLLDRADALHRFIERVNALAERARSLGVSLLIENNVLSKENSISFGDNPLLMANAEECVSVMEQTPNNVNLLVDVAHLKVSAHSLQYDPIEFLTTCEPWIQAYHLSDNDGTSDSNEAVSKDSWFWPHIRKDLDYYSLEVYGVDVSQLKAQRELTALMLGQ